MTESRVVDAVTLAAVLGVSREWIYEHAAELGGVTVLDGPRPRWRFSLDRAVAAWERAVMPGSAPMEPISDPLDFADAVLDGVPDDPIDANGEHLQLLLAAAEGLTRHALTLRAGVAALAVRLDDDEPDLDLLSVERSQLYDREERLRLADNQINNYTAAALAAHGFDLAELIGD